MRQIKITRKQYDTINKIYRIGGFCLVLCVLVVYSIFIGKLAEFTLLFISYFISKDFYDKQFHADSLKVCLLSSIIIFCSALKLCVEIYFSIMFSGLFGLLISFVSYKVGEIQLKLEDYDYIEPRYNILLEKYVELNKQFDLNTCSEEQLLNRCKELGFNHNQIDYCIDAFIKRLTSNELADKYCIEVQSAKNKKQTYKHKLIGKN